jgi:hypothetical protein
VSTDKTPIESFKDARNLDVRRGDTVAFACNTYDWLTLKIGIVEDIYTVGDRYGRDNLRVVVRAEGGDKPSVLWYGYRIVLLEKGEASAS